VGYLHLGGLNFYALFSFLFPQGGKGRNFKKIDRFGIDIIVNNLGLNGRSAASVLADTKGIGRPGGIQVCLLFLVLYQEIYRHFPDFRGGGPNLAARSLYQSLDYYILVICTAGFHLGHTSRKRAG